MSQEQTASSCGCRASVASARQRRRVLQRLVPRCPDRWPASAASIRCVLSVTMRCADASARRQRLPREGHHPLPRARRGQEALLHRLRVQDVELRVGARLRIALGARHRVQSTEERQRLIDAAQAKGDESKRVQAGPPEAIGTVGKNRLFGLLQQPVRETEIAAGIQDVPGFHHPHSRFQHGID